MNETLLDSVDSVIEEAVDARVTPGAVYAIGRAGGVIRLRGVGHTDYAPGAPPVDRSTVYDLASLTKVMGTTTAVMLLVDRGRMDLDAPLSRYLTVWPAGAWRDEVTVRRLLAHSSGLPPFLRFWHPDQGALRGRDAVMSAIAALPADYPPGTRTVYSDLGFILLGAAVEEVTGRRLDEFLAAEVWAPLGMDDTGFNPLPGRMTDIRAEGGMPPVMAEPLVPAERIAPTEIDSVFRHAHVHGVVHDENAFALGGVAGHAGLFSTAPDVARFAQMLLAGGRTPTGRLVRASTVRRFTERQPGSTRALGWDTPPGGTDIAAAFSASAFGHTGFTGTSLWIDPERDVFVVLLTNRVNPTRDNPHLTDVRRRVHELAARAADPRPGGLP